jgi:hypothetical protein
VLARFIEGARAHRRRWRVVRTVVGIPVIAAIAWIEIGGVESWWIRAPAMLGAGFVLYEMFRGFRAYRDGFKRDVVAPILDLVHGGLRYEPRGTLPREELERAGFFAGGFGSCSGEDLVEGRFGATSVRFCEMTVRERKGLSWWLTPAAAREKPLFRGLLLVADFNKTLAGRTVVLPDEQESALGRWAHLAQALDRRRGELVRLEDSSFERIFKVYADDQVEARYALSTSLMQRLVEFRQAAGTTPLLSLSGSTLRMAIPAARNRLEPPGRLQLAGFGSPEDVRVEITRLALGYAADVQLALDVVEGLALNTRIWTQGTEVTR